MSHAGGFDVHQPRTLAGALDLLAEHGAAAQVIAGGTDLVPKLRAGRLAPRHLVSIGRIEELAAITWSDDQGLGIGAGARISDVAAHPAVQQHFPALAHACTVMATTHIRNMGTVAGNLSNASPCADTSSPLLVYGASVVKAGPRGRVTLALSDLFLGPGHADIAPDELVVSIRVPPPPPRSGSCYLRLSARSRVDMAAAGAASWLCLGADGRVSAARLAMSAVAPTPLGCPAAAALLVGHTPDPARLAEAAAACAASARPIDDVRATARYRRAIVEVLMGRTLQRSVALAEQGVTP